ncbi:MAG: type I-E CRISPR-associated endonuclease Cas1 [Firmicutes bacterium]|nr:type I-E CRISPR-associated endonuclease Cas1 [Bacillota bacterium]
MGSSSLLPGRLGLAGTRVPHVDRHGLLWVSRGRLYVVDGTLRFQTAGSDDFDAGEYAIPYQSVSMILAGPGTSVTHDVFRILARHGTLLAAVGDGGVKFYTAPPMGRGRSSIARAHAELWADAESRLYVARRMYAIRFGEVLPRRDISALRGMEGGRMKKLYEIMAQKYGVRWQGRRYDRREPESADLPNQAINHAATFVEAAGDIAVAAVGALPPLGFIHEDSSNAFTLDIADLWRAELTLPLAFSVCAKVQRDPSLQLEREIRLEAARWFRKLKLIPSMIDRIKELLNVNDDDSHS